MYNNILARLKSSDKRVRMQAVTDLAHTEDPAVLKHLAYIYKSDEDADVRNAARKAGQYIRKKQQEEELTKQAPFTAPIEVNESYLGTGGDGPHYEMTEASASLGELTPVKKKNVPTVSVSSATEKRAQGLVDRAMEMSIAGNKTGAVTALRQAFKLNPNLAHDDYAVTLASDVLGLPKAAAAEELLFPGGEDKSKRGSDRKKINWITALADLTTYALVVTVLVFMASLAVVQILRDTQPSLEDFYISEIQKIAREAGARVVFTPELNDFLDNASEVDDVIEEISSAEIPVIFGFALASGFGAAVVLAIWFGMQHFVAVNFFNGLGTYRDLVHAVTPMVSIVTVLQALISGGFLYFTFSSESSFITDYLVEGGAALDETALMAQFGDMMPLVIVLSLLPLVISYWYSRLVGKVYEFGTGKGYTSTLISVVAISILAAGVGVLLTPLVEAWVTSLA